MNSSSDFVPLYPLIQKDKLYPELLNRDPNYEQETEKQNSQDKEDHKANAYISSDDDSEAVTNAIAIVNEHRKETRRILRLSTSPRKK